MGSFADAAMTGDLSKVLPIAGVTAVFVCLQLYTDYLPRYRREKLVHQIGADLRRDVVRKIEGFSFEEKQKHDDGSLISMLDNDITTIEDEYLTELGFLMVQVSRFTLSVAMSLRIQPAMTAIMLLVSLLPVVFPKLMEKKLQQAKEASQSAKAGYLSSVTQILNGFFPLKVFDGFRGINVSHDHENDNRRSSQIRFERIRSILYSGSYGCGSLVYFGAWVLGLVFVGNGRITLPLLITFSNLMNYVAGTVEVISEDYTQTMAAKAVCRRVLKFLDDDTDEAAHWGSRPLAAVSQVSVEGLSYAAGDKTLLKNVTLTLRKGERVALLGESGSGKSTLMKVLAAMYEGQGELVLNGRPRREYAYGDFRKQVTLLEQKSFVFDGSIRDNVTMFSRDDGRARQVLDAARLGPWYESRGGSLDALIGSDRGALSGGEERRLDLARILYRNASFVMLDEPLSGLDADTRRQVEKVIESLHCDILLVSVHDPSPEFLATFDRVITVRDGQIV